ncbi:hypothetical protein EVAR_16419_1 [Eumeta japonica]|uniref:Uncharacterized protein n=1 Tax=Eumeta variegata TaxID=151549 RepID=A0A4C1UKJ5_EUMVA|nr:hypothetical protein EVAR_16419_1 [Eumeta japonica]
MPTCARSDSSEGYNTKITIGAVWGCKEVQMHPLVAHPGGQGVTPSPSFVESSSSYCDELEPLLTELRVCATSKALILDPPCAQTTSLLKSALCPVANSIKLIQ